MATTEEQKKKAAAKEEQKRKSAAKRKARTVALSTFVGALAGGPSVGTAAGKVAAWVLEAKKKKKAAAKRNAKKTTVKKTAVKKPKTGYSASQQLSNKPHGKEPRLFLSYDESVSPKPPGWRQIPDRVSRKALGMSDIDEMVTDMVPFMRTGDGSFGIDKPLYIDSRDIKKVTHAEALDRKGYSPSRRKRGY